MTQTQKLQLEYWTQFYSLFYQRSDFHITPNPHACHWTEVRFGKPLSIFSLKMNIRSNPRQIAVQLVIEGSDRKQIFQDLYRDREQIEDDLGHRLTWEKPVRTKEKTSLAGPGADPFNREKWAEQHARLLQTVEAFHRIFARRP